MAVFKGGRGSKVPYTTQMMRVPTPLKDEIQQFIDSYRASVSEGFTDAPGEQSELKQPISQALPSKEEATEKAQDIVNSSKSARISLMMFLKWLYNEKIELQSSQSRSAGKQREEAV